MEKSPNERLPLNERRKRIRDAQRAAAAQEGVTTPPDPEHVSVLSVVMSGLLGLAGLGSGVGAPVMAAGHGTAGGWAVIMLMVVTGVAAFVAVIQLVSRGSWIVASMTTAAVLSFATVLATLIITSVPGHATGGAPTLQGSIGFLGLAVLIRSRRESARLRGRREVRKRRDRPPPARSPA